MANKKTFIQIPPTLDDITLRGLLEDMAVRINSLMNGICVDRPMFLAQPASDQENIAVGSEVTVVFGTEVYDIGSNFASNTFTAPIDGKYHLYTNLKIGSVDSASNFYQLGLATTSKIIYETLSTNRFSADLTYWQIGLSGALDMSKDDTAYVWLKQNNGTAQTDISTISYFGGFLIG